MPNRRPASLLFPALLLAALLPLTATAQQGEESQQADDGEETATAVEATIELTEPEVPQAVMRDAETAEEPVLGEPMRTKIDLPPELSRQLHGYRPPAWRLPPGTLGPDIEDDGELPTCLEAQIHAEECEQVAERRITEAGTVVIDCADGSSWRTNTRGEDVYTQPAGRSCRVPRRYLTATGMPEAEEPVYPPTLPPGEVGSTEWASDVNDWLENEVGVQLEQRIRSLLSEDSFARYQELEDESSRNLYQRIDYRLSFLDKLLRDL